MKNNKFKKIPQMNQSLGLTFIVLGVLLFVIDFIMNIKSNVPLFAGLFFVIAGIAGYIYSLKKG